MLALALSLGAAAGCKSESGPEPLTAATKPALSKVSAERTDLMFRFRDAEGAWQQAVTLAEVPETAREAVQVIDLSLSPAERNAGHYVQIFDLRAADADGVFPGRLVPRAELEQVLAAAAVKPTFAPITMYSASWCGYCKKARAFLTDQGIPFEEKDVETTPGASAELAASAAKAGVQTGGGVPVFVVGDRILQGFDPDALLKAAKGG
jgi:glutaredoxin